MEFSVQPGGIDTQHTGCVVAGVYRERQLSPSASLLDRASRGAIAKVLARGDLDGELDRTLLLHDLPHVPAERVLLVGLGEAPAFDERCYRVALASAIDALRRTGTVHATLCVDELPVNGRDSAWKAEQAVLVVRDRLYRFDRLKRRPPPAQHALKTVALHLADARHAAAAHAAVARAVAIADGIALAKDLGNLPGNLCTPAYLGERARELAERDGFEATVHALEAIEQLGMGAFLAVARGSRQAPRLIVMTYRGGAGEAPPVVLVGKGITFDAGGISIKPAPEMDEMKFDMCGAASVFGALHAAARMKLPLNVVGIVPAAENMPGGNATKPGDIVTTMSGRTVEILDTDSEGRLALCDALTFARRFDPAAIVDIATLTGEIVKALGDVASGLFSNSDALAREVLQAGDRAWDRAWQMPLWDDYQDALTSNFADLPNIGSGTDCAATAACFLSRFTEGLPWAHLDIAGTASRSGADKGATGRPVALLAHFLAARAAAPAVGRRESDRI
jgi:leucyl aminopeptidase